MALFWLLVLISPLVFIHELGHYAAARRFGVRCHEFAIGMGPRIASFRRWGTEFTIRAFPLGGFVSMLGADPDAETAPEDVGCSLTDKPVWQRMIIYLAGPAMNVLIAVPIFWMFFMGETHTEGPEIGMVLDGTAAAEAGFLPGDTVTAIDGRDVRYFDQIRTAASSSPGEQLTFTLDRDGEPVTLTVTPEPVEVRDPLLGLRNVTRGQLGVVWGRYPSYVHVDANTPAFTAGLRSFDHVVAIDGEPVDAWLDVEEVLRGSGQEHVLDVERAELTADTFATISIRSFERITLPALPWAQLGISSAEATVFDVRPGSPAANAGILRGDRVVGADGRPVTSLGILLQTLEAAPDVAHDVSLVRDGAPTTASMTPVTMEVTGELQSAQDIVMLGIVGLPAGTVAHELVAVPALSRVTRSIGQAFAKTFEYLIGIFLGVVFLITGSVDSSNLGGPIMIADVARRAAGEGALTFLRTMAIISINLGIVNLVPIPGLDGGHLVLLTAEGIKREPLSFRARQIANYVGLVCIVLLMLFVFKNDIERYWDGFATWLNS